MLIVEAAFDTQPDSSIDDAEARDMIAEVVDWILQAPSDQTPSPDDVVRKTIEVMVVDVILTEVGATIRKDGASYESRKSSETMIRNAAEELASQVSLSATGATAAEITSAIDSCVEQLGKIFGEGNS
ncbi:hypothetical protein ACSMXN_21780 [Jatrophihabitans sp. DSM 45814]